jgi:hypothetical protein
MSSFWSAEGGGAVQELATGFIFKLTLVAN